MGSIGREMVVKAHGFHLLHYGLFGYCNDCPVLANGARSADQLAVFEHLPNCQEKIMFSKFSQFFNPPMCKRGCDERETEDRR